MSSLPAASSLGAIRGNDTIGTEIYDYVLPRNNKSENREGRKKKEKNPLILSLKKEIFHRKFNFFSENFKFSERCFCLFSEKLKNFTFLIRKGFSEISNF